MYQFVCACAQDSKHHTLREPEPTNNNKPMRRHTHNALLYLLFSSKRFRSALGLKGLRDSASQTRWDCAPNDLHAIPTLSPCMGCATPEHRRSSRTTTRVGPWVLPEGRETLSDKETHLTKPGTKPLQLGGQSDAPRNNGGNNQRNAAGAPQAP